MPEYRCGLYAESFRASDDEATCTDASHLLHGLGEELFLPMANRPKGFWPLDDRATRTIVDIMGIDPDRLEKLGRQWPDGVVIGARGDSRGTIRLPSSHSYVTRTGHNEDYFDNPSQILVLWGDDLMINLAGNATWRINREHPNGVVILLDTPVSLAPTLTGRLLHEVVDMKVARDHHLVIKSARHEEGETRISLAERYGMPR